MVDQVGLYYVALTKDYRGFTKGDPISATIFNIVAGAVIRHWVAVMAGE